MTALMFYFSNVCLMFMLRLWNWP